MNMERLQAGWVTLESEYFKNMAVLTLDGLSRHKFGRRFLDIARGRERVEDPRLHVHVAGMNLESPVLVGAGWSDDGRAVDGLNLLGFAGVEVGTVTLYPQCGNPHPRMWYKNGVGLNWMGFNSPGAQAVAHNLEGQKLSGVVGINLGKNKDTPDHLVAQELAASANVLAPYANYFVLNFQSPNTEGLRDSMLALLKESFMAVDETLRGQGHEIPILFKTSVDMSKEELYETLDIAIRVGAAGIVDSNTTVDPALKAKYGWAGKPGGLSGNDPEYQRRVLENTKLIATGLKGSSLILISAGGISDSAAAIERTLHGAHLVEVVTGIRQNKAKTPSNINLGYLAFVEREGINNYESMIGAAL